MTQTSGAFHRHVPALPLSEFVESLWISEGYAATHAGERLLPTGTMELVFAVDAGGRATSAVVGARSEYLELDTSRPFSVVGVHFRPGGGFPFFGAPADALRSQTLSLDALWGREADSLGDQLWESATHERRFHLLETALLGRARRGLERHRAVRYALDAFDRARGASPVAAVVDRTGLSWRRFAHLFRLEVGLTPKQFCRIRRFNAALERIEQLTDPDWTAIALSCGYFDQAHFNHDFREFSGLSPSAYLRRRVARSHVVTSD